jgi:hypothetical protein
MTSAPGRESTRWAIIIVAVAALAGALLILTFENSQESLRSWLQSEPSQMASRELLVLAIMGVLVVLPPLGFALYLWKRAGTVARDRARIAKLLAIGLVIGAAALAFILFRFALTLAPEQGPIISM